MEHRPRRLSFFGGCGDRGAAYGRRVRGGGSVRDGGGLDAGGVRVGLEFAPHGFADAQVTVDAPRVGQFLDHEQPAAVLDGMAHLADTADTRHALAEVVHLDTDARGVGDQPDAKRVIAGAVPYCVRRQLGGADEHVVEPVMFRSELGQLSSDEGSYGSGGIGGGGVQEFGGVRLNHDGPS